MLFPLDGEPNELIVSVLIVCLLLYNLGEGIRTVVRIRQLNTPPLTNATFFRTGV